MALGAIGAVAAAAAALLGSTATPHTNIALDGPQNAEPLGAATSVAGSPNSAGAHLTVSVTTATSPALPGGLGLPRSSSPTPGSPSPTVASSGGFFVSVNQRDGDPYSVQILLRNAGTTPISWRAVPSVSWLILSQTSGTLAPGQSTNLTATAGGPGTPDGQWTAQIAFQPGGIDVVVHGGIPVVPPPSSSGAPASSGSSGTPSSPPPSSAGPTATNGGGGGGTPTAGSGTPTATPSSTSSSAKPSTSGSGTAGTGTPVASGGTSGTSATPDASGSASPSRAPGGVPSHSR